MIRVIYRWRVDDDHHRDFRRWWHEGTVRIRSTYPGAMGSTLCTRTGRDDVLVAIARWRSEEDLARFWQDPGGRPFPHAVMEAAEILVERDHLTEER